MGGELIRGWQEGDKTPGPALMWFCFVARALAPVICPSPWTSRSCYLSKLLGFGLSKGICLNSPEESQKSHPAQRT